MKIRQEKGITLVALIITIIVLLILAMVSINLVMNGGIIGKSKNAVDKYSQEEIEEQIKLAHSEFEMQKYGLNPETNEATFLHTKLDPLYGTANVDIMGTYPLMVTVKNAGNTYVIKVASNGNTEKVELGSWTQNGAIITNTKTNQTLEVGDTVYYDSGVAGYEGTEENQGKWGILGVENGNLLIMSKEKIGEVSLQGRTAYYSYSTVLDNLCGIFQNPYYANYARSVKIEDLNRVTQYIPESPVTYTYTMVGGKVKRNDQNSLTSDSYFEHVDGRKLQEDSSISVTVDYYSYQLGEKISTDSKAYKLLKDNDHMYSLNSPDVREFNDLVYWGFRIVYYSAIYDNGMFFAWNGSESGSSEVYVRAVVSLKSNIKVVGDGTTGYTLQVN